MSFRSRLLVFFTIIVVVPMIAVALVLFALTQDSEHGKVDARLASGVRIALSFYEEGRENARAALARVASDDELTDASVEVMHVSEGQPATGPGYVYATAFPCDQPGGYGFTVRVVR